MNVTLRRTTRQEVKGGLAAVQSKKRGDVDT